MFFLFFLKIIILRKIEQADNVFSVCKNKRILILILVESTKNAHPHPSPTKQNV